MPQTSINHAAIGRTSGPATLPEVQGVRVGMRPESARSTRKLFLGLAVALVAAAASRAGSAAVPGIHADQQDSHEQSLIFQEFAQLRESPAVQNCALPAPGLDPSADARQILNGDSAIGAFSFGNDLLRDVVIDPGGKAPLLAGKCPQLALCRPGLYPLQLASKPAAPSAYGPDVRAGMPLAVRVGGDVRNPEVYAQKVGRFDSLLIGQVYRSVKIEFAFAAHQIHLPADAIQALPLVVSADPGNDPTAAGQCPQAYPIGSFEAQDARVISDGPMGSENWTSGFVPLESFHSLSDGADGHLGRQAEAIPDFPIATLVDQGLAENASLESPPSGQTGRFVDALHGLEQIEALRGIALKLNLKREFHVFNSYIWSQPAKVFA